MLSESQEKLSLYFKNAVDGDSIRQCYIVEGPEGIGKKYLAENISRYIMCQSGQACGNCNACKSLEHGANPDCHVISNGDKKVIELQKIRNIIKEAYIKPVSGKYKLFIIQNAHLLDAPGQNALLKLIEEPPFYAVFMLICDNLNTILPTIKSRSVILRLEPWSVADLKKVFPLSDSASFMYSYCLGNIGTLISISQDEDFKSLRTDVINSFTKMIVSDDAEIYNAIDLWIQNKDRKEDILNILIMFLRDILFYKNGLNQNIANSDKLKEIQKLSEELQYKTSFDMLQEVNNAPRLMGKYGNFNMLAQTLIIKLKKMCKAF